MGYAKVIQASFDRATYRRRLEGGASEEAELVACIKSHFSGTAQIFL